jgi:uncharacterized protein
MRECASETDRSGAQRRQKPMTKQKPAAPAGQAKPDVFFVRVSGKETPATLAGKTDTLLKASALAKIVRPDSLVAVKQHLGEEGNQGFIKPAVSRVVGETIRARGGSPLLVETNTLYRGRRSNAYDHLMLAYEHGFTLENAGMPVVILDGINGQNQRAVAIPGKHYKSVFVVSDLPFFDSIFVLSHVKGHMMSGMAGALKNLGMGFSSRAGKLAQHADFRPHIRQQKCIRCELCGKYCPVDAPGLQADGRMEINLELCTGCGECYVACRSGAITFDWAGTDRKFHEKVVEHALGAVIGHPGKVAYLNFFIHISKQCDCWAESNPPLYEDVGIFASYDPVAIDRACYDLGKELLGRDVFKEMWPRLTPLVQLEHGELLGLGTQKYELREIPFQEGGR